MSFCKGEEQPPSTLKLVQIYFDTATFDEIERDEKVKFTAALGLVGGTMGLLTGFSIISGIEVVFFLVKLICPLVVNFVKQKVDNLRCQMRQTNKQAKNTLAGRLERETGSVSLAAALAPSCASADGGWPGAAGGRD